MKIDHFLISVIIFALITVLGISFTSDVNLNHDTNIGSSPGFARIQNLSNTIIANSTSTAEAQSDAVLDAEDGLSEVSFLDSLIKGTYNAVKDLGKMLNLVSEMPSAINEELNDRIKAINRESVIQVVGTVNARPEGTTNKKLPTGEV